MSGVTVALEGGFHQDHVVLRVDGATAFDRPDVTTRMQIGLADTVELPGSTAPRQLQVQLPDRGLTADLTLDQSLPYIRVALVDGEVEVTASADPPFYV